MIKRHWIQTNPKRHVRFLCTGVCYGDESNRSGMVEEDGSYITASNQATVRVAAWGKDELSGNRKPKVCSSFLLRVRGARASFSSRMRLSFNDQSYTTRPPQKTGLRDRNAYTAVTATSQMCCCLWTTRIIWWNVPTFAVFPSFVETNESRLE